MSSESDINSEFTFTWKIENYSLCPQKNGEAIDSPVFRAETFGGSKWFVKFYPKGHHKISEEHISCFLCKSKADTDGEIFKIKYQIEISGTDGHSIASYKSPIRTFNDKIDNDSCHFLMKICQLTDKWQCWTDDTLVLRCRLISIEPRMPATGCIASTKIGFDQCSFTWNVKYSDSPSWSDSKMNFFSKTSQIEIVVTAPEDDIEINVRKIEKGISASRFLLCKLCLLDVKGVEQNLKSAAHRFESTKESWKVPSFIKKSELKADERKYLKNGSLSLKCQFFLSNGIESGEIEGYQQDIIDFAPMVDTVSDFKEDLRRMYTSKKQTDVKLRVNNETFSAHKFILSARSPVFSAMFEQDMTKYQEGFVDITGVDSKTLSSLLEFMYTGTADRMDYESALKLLIAADKYQILSLKEKCAEFFRLNLSNGNVCEVLTYADMVGHELLKTSSIDYIKAHASKILSSAEWSQCILNNAKLSTEILYKLSIN